MLELGSQAEILFRPPVRQFSMLKVTHFDAVVDAGYRYGLERIAAWRDGRVAPPPDDDDTVTGLVTPARD